MQVSQHYQQRLEAMEAASGGVLTIKRFATAYVVNPLFRHRPRPENRSAFSILFIRPAGRQGTGLGSAFASVSSKNTRQEFFYNRQEGGRLPC